MLLEQFALMDFLYLAQFESHTSDTILEMQECLKRFHDNKSIFIDLGIREHLSLLKLHSLSHYATSIQLFGTTDNYNTKQLECLHIDLTKDAYCVTNHKDKYSQMTKWLERHERIHHLLAFIDWIQEHGEHQSPYQMAMGPAHTCPLALKMAKNPSKGSP